MSVSQIYDLERPGGLVGRPYDELLGAPSTSKGDDDFTRAIASYSNRDQRFRVAKRSYERQYAQLYFSRLMRLSSAMKERVQRLWPGIPVCSILEVQESRETIVIGTLYKNMKLKPSILDEYTKDRGLKAALGATNFCSDDDSVVLEDDSARMSLALPGAVPVAGEAAETCGALLGVQELVTGVVLAVRGMHEPSSRNFVVSGVCLPGMAPNEHPLPALRSGGLLDAAAAAPDPRDKYIALASGLCLGGSRTDMLRTQLALDFLTGNLGSPQEQQLAAQIVRLVVAGGSIGHLDALASAAAPSYGAAGRMGGGAGGGAGSGALQSVRDLDLLMAEAASGLPVDVMPGPEDPANVALPQQPMHRCLFPAAGSHGCFVRATNPHELEVEGVRLLGTSGQNVDDMAKYCAVRDRLTLMQRSLSMRHLAPTAPDTLTCYPFVDDDPFVLSDTPHVYFVGNQPEFGCRLVQLQGPGGGAEGAAAAGGGGTVVRLVAVPSFSRSGTIVLLNLRTLQCHPLRFDGSLGLGA